ncbi:MAG: hypothetical protein Kow0056_13130 [Coriobacteriia bacterium]
MRPLRDLIEEVAERLDPGKARYALRIESVWPEVAGKAIADKTKSLRFKDERLTVVVASAAWANELSLMGPELVRRLNDTLGETVVREIRFFAGPDPGDAG